VRPPILKIKKLNSIKRYFRIGREDIGYLAFILESYSGLAVLRTIDSRKAIVEILIAPQSCDLFEDLMANLRHKEKLNIIPITIYKNKIIYKKMKSEIGT